jgi:hypothetical protein
MMILLIDYLSPHTINNVNKIPIVSLAHSKGSHIFAAFDILEVSLLATGTVGLAVAASGPDKDGGFL